MHWSHTCSAYCSRQIKDRIWSRCKDTQGSTLACIFHIPDEILGQKYFTCSSITGLISSEITYWHGQSVLMSLTMELSLARISVCLKDSLAFFSLSLKTTTIYSTWARFRKTRASGRNNDHLISPKKLIACPVFQAIPDVEELSDSMFSHMVGIFLRLVPFQGCTRRQKTH